MYICCPLNERSFLLTHYVFLWQYPLFSFTGSSSSPRSIQSREFYVFVISKYGRKPKTICQLSLLLTCKNSCVSFQNPRQRSSRLATAKRSRERILQVCHACTRTMRPSRPVFVCVINQNRSSKETTAITVRYCTSRGNFLEHCLTLYSWKLAVFIFVFLSMFAGTHGF